MKTLIQEYKEKFQKTLDSFDLEKYPEMERVAISIRYKTDLADYLLEKNVTTLKELKTLQRQLLVMRTQALIISECVDVETKDDIIFRLDSESEFLKVLIHNLRERSV